MEKKLLPIGTVVLLKEGRKKLMIYGRLQIQESSQTVFDYIGCLYPEGYLNPDLSFVFNPEDITEVFHLGFDNEEEQLMQDMIREVKAFK
ncbi:DUF4176 domain-containing protein [Ectobacillus sp. JY-23]|uniref:DUF4176 domain-containing protein n=1 Tax=Ectobacillus sp. JY-23 TaxID=2933872 RepID=UPI001FF5B370|nr:DUF4176 domain-containing protein [Ectobacillus sp. JY-23]UOY92499.1 DUF4176 domain-containing protein [Ectobacillus sp. JY-23]